MPDRQVMVIPFYHCDVVWRRPPEEQRAIRERQYDAALEALARFPEFRFEFDQAVLVREYLERRPEALSRMRRYLAEGRLDITGGEETIPDTNLVSGEGLVRNFFLGRLWFEETLGAQPVVANLDDAFGLSPQLPQIFVGFGYRYFRDARTPGLDRALARRGILWEGLDGSRIFYMPAQGHVSEGTHVCNLPVVYSPRERVQASLEEALAVEVPVVYCAYGSEEDLVNAETIQTILSFPCPRGVSLRFALARECLAEAERCCPEPPIVKGEFNPSQPGTHITRITLKQAYRAAEWAAMVSEAACACASLLGAPYPQEGLAHIWRRLSYVQFRDSLCGCHSQAVNRHVMNYCSEVSRTARRLSASALRRLSPPAGPIPGVVAFNALLHARREPLLLPLPAGTSLAGDDGKALPAERRGKQTLVVAGIGPMGVTQWRLVRARAPEPKTLTAERAVGKWFHVGPYRVKASHEGVVLEHREWGQRLVEGSLPEIRFRHEDGTMWDERFLGPIYTEKAGGQWLVRKEEGPLSVRLFWRGRVEGDPTADPAPPGWNSLRDGKPIIFSDLRRLTWEKELVFYRALERIDVHVRLDFRGTNTEVLLGFPLLLNLHRSRALYEVPFGAVERKPYYEIPVGSPELEGAPLHLAALGGKGAWPALTWVAYSDDEWGMVLANRGTPSHRLMSGLIEVGVLRSPTTLSSNFHPPVEARENGRHVYHFALQPFRGDLFSSGAYRLGAELNAAPLVRLTRVEAAEVGFRGLLNLTAPGVALSAFKHAERRQGYLLRTFETAGRPSRGTLETAFPVVRAYETDLMERPVREVDVRDLTWRPFEINSLLLEVADESKRSA